MSFRFTRKTDYALVALAVLAEQPEASPLSARQIAEAHDLPVPLLMNLLKQLNRAGLVDSSRGAGGGYRLARPADQVGLAEVIDAIEGPIALTPCCDEPETAAAAPAFATATDAAAAADNAADEEPCQTCRATGNCPITRTIQRVNQLVTDLLASLTLRDVMDDELNLFVRVGRADPDDQTTLVELTASPRDDQTGPTS